MIYDELIDDIMLHFSKEKYAEEVKEAKNEFHRSVGIFDEESIDLESKINLFMDWYIFHRILKSEQVPPIKLISRGEEYKVQKGNEVLIKNMCASRYSLFEFSKVKDEDVYVKDLFSNYNIVLKKSPFILGFSKNEIFSARLFPYEDSFVFSKAFCIHPEQATKYILKEVKKINKINIDESISARQDLIYKLLRMRYKIDQYKHIKLKDIYTSDPKLRI
ncbi:MAG: hypothetical protein H6625_07610 [Bdellovibrionaceae bacterium]|nr:hypothetical protein [Pseudobdellovibrionaceae bacterium]